MVSGCCWCPCVPMLSRRGAPTQPSSQIQQQHHQLYQPAYVAPVVSNKRKSGAFSISAATERADMVQMFYYENRGKCCRKLLKYNGYPNKVSFNFS